MDAHRHGFARPAPPIVDVVPIRQVPCLKHRPSRKVAWVLLTLLALGCSSKHYAPRNADINVPPQGDDWADFAQLPDWSGVWNPNITDQNARIKTDPEPWTPEAAGKVAELVAEEHAGRRD